MWSVRCDLVSSSGHWPANNSSNDLRWKCDRQIFESQACVGDIIGMFVCRCMVSKRLRTDAPTSWAQWIRINAKNCSQRQGPTRTSIIGKAAAALERNRERIAGMKCQLPFQPENKIDASNLQWSTVMSRYVCSVYYWFASAQL